MTSEQSLWCSSPTLPTYRLFPDTCHQDNHDAEAFLKPVAKSDVPDYYDGTRVTRLFVACSYTTSRLRSDIQSYGSTINA